VLELNCIVAYSHPYNLFSISVALKVGMKAQDTVRLEWTDVKSEFYKVTKKEFLK